MTGGINAKRGERLKGKQFTGEEAVLGAVKGPADAVDGRFLALPDSG